MKEKFSIYKTKMSESWTSFSPVTKWSVIGSFFLTLLIIGIFIFFNSQSNYSVLYSDLSPAEAGEIKASIESQAIPVEISSDGKTVSVPEEHLANLKVSLAAEGIPKNGNVNYGTFSENMGLGMTDRHFDVVERDAMQNELAYLIQQIDGVTEANVMITLPKENIWITDEEQTSTASIVVKGDSSLQLDQKQINGLYHLISKSVPSLPADQIVIMDQNGQVFEVQDANQADTNLSVYQQHREIQKGIEQDIQRELQQMLGLLLGQDKVVVSVMTNIDFTKEKREEQLVEPVVAETNEGLDISVERIIETYSSEGTVIEDAAGTGETEVANYPGVNGAGNSESERTEERINSEVNRINRQIEMSPYVVDDITINVGVEPPIPDNPASLSQENIADISNLLKNTVSTSLSMNDIQATDAELEDRISVFATEFQGRPAIEDEKPEVTFFENIPNNLLMVIGAAIVLVMIIVITLLLLRKKRKKKVEAEEYEYEGFEQALARSNQVDTEEIDISSLGSKLSPKQQTIEKLAQGRPEDFAKLLRAWMADD